MRRKLPNMKLPLLVFFLQHNLVHTSQSIPPMPRVRDAALCSLIYVDLGTNDGDTLLQFVGAAPTNRDFDWVSKFVSTVSPGWTAATSCVHAFEAAPRWTHRLHDVARMIRHNVSDLHLYTETAILADRSKQEVILQLDTGTKKGAGSSVIAGSMSLKGQKGPEMVKVAALNLADWLEQSPRLKASLRGVPVVFRMDIEGEEYGTLTDLILSGVARRLAARGVTLHIAIEWHRFAKDRAYGAEHLRLMSKLDLAFLWTAPQTRGMLCKQMEKVITYMLASANVSTTDRYGPIRLNDRAYPRDYMSNDPNQDKQTKTTSISDSEFRTAVSLGRL